MPGLMGGFFEQEHIEDQHRNLLHSLKGQVDSKLGATHNNYHIDKLFTQIVGGKYHHYHLTADNGQKLSALIFEPLPHTNDQAVVVSVAPGHTEARNPN